ncbi:AsmA-like C-terminal region-containing protein [Hymenobacter sp. BT559]|uniref:AsmA family protein n=1 Tax=Hymenobacter sp. BT559 TaxID=2795729 RepID=UPI0018EAC657|nr:AsmA-like C-terminal region-containing protein [Hymenobacter sp. BT559]MBJ6144126.1 AsmA family protein [Hymenobacter sp. BT559]
MRKILFGFLLFLVVLVAAAALAPFLFKDKLRALADKQIAQRVRAKVQYNPADIDVTLLSTFPDLGLDIKNLRVIGVDSFSRDTLAYLPRLRVGLDLMSVIKGQQIDIKSVNLDQPDIAVKVLKSGRANWDIMISDSAAAAKGQDTSAVNLAIQGWKIDNGRLRYDDRSIPFRLDARGLNHTGKGDFAKNIFDLTSNTKIAKLTANYAGVDYLTDKQVDADIAMAMDLGKSLYTFKENQVKLNDFPFSFAGAIGLPNATDITYDITFKALQTDFKNILSLVPGVFNEQFKDVQASGQVAFNGYYKGVQNKLRMPGYGVNLTVTNARFHYPQLPREAKNINVAMVVDNPSGFTNNVKVNVSKFHLDLGNDPVDGNVIIDGLEPMKVDGRVKANVNLAEALKVYPVAGINMRGQFFVDATAKGTYSKTQMPVVNAAIKMSNGYVKSNQFPAPIEDINLSGTVVNKTGQVNDTYVNLPQFHMVLEGEPLDGRLAAHNINSPIFDANVKGTVDLTKMTKIFPLEGMTVTGRVSGDIAAAGNMADVEAGRYQNVKASGAVKANNITYKSKDLPQGVKISSAAGTFNNNQINIQSLNGTAGSSDFAANGTVSNYLGYLFTPGQPLRGTMNVTSHNFNVNEFMVDPVSEKPTAGAVKAAPAKADGVVPIPKFFDLVLNSKVDNVTYDNLKLQNASGTVTVKNEVATLKNLTFNTLGATFGTTGSYNTQDLAHPKFDLGLDIKQLDFQKAFSAFNTVKALVPLASTVQGVFNTKFSASGEMGQDMLPKLSTLSGSGLFDIVKAAVLQSPTLTQIASLTTLPELKNLQVLNREVKAQIVNGNLVVQPFDLTVGDIKMTLGGSNSLQGILSYVAAINAPTGKLGSAVSNKLTQLTGVQNIQGTDRVTLGLNIGGNIASPSVKLTSGSLKDQGKAIVTNVVKTKLTNTLLDLANKNRAKTDSTQKATAITQQNAQEQLNLEVQKRKLEAQEKARQAIGKGLNSLFGGGRKTTPAAPAATPTPADTTKKATP